MIFDKNINSKGQSFQQTGLQKLDIQVQKKEVGKFRRQRWQVRRTLSSLPLMTTAKSQQLNTHQFKKRKLDPYLTTHKILFQKWIKDLKVLPEAIKLLEENLGENLHDIGFDSDFFSYDNKNTVKKGKIVKLDFTKFLKHLCIKDAINRMKRQSTFWEKIFANHTSDKGLIT